ncbi:MAG: hypothetical protein HYU87_06450, partial [Chloroflexi bacterium]|nr:hypothetical protein [Chloroflexota bacterium]
MDEREAPVGARAVSRAPLGNGDGAFGMLERSRELVRRRRRADRRFERGVHAGRGVCPRELRRLAERLKSPEGALEQLLSLHPRPEHRAGRRIHREQRDPESALVAEPLEQAGRRGGALEHATGASEHHCHSRRAHGELGHGPVVDRCEVEGPLEVRERLGMREAACLVFAGAPVIRER